MNVSSMARLLLGFEFPKPNVAGVWLPFTAADQSCKPVRRWTLLVDLSDLVQHLLYMRNDTVRLLPGTPAA